MIGRETIPTLHPWTREAPSVSLDMDTLYGGLEESLTQQPVRLAGGLSNDKLLELAAKAARAAGVEGERLPAFMAEFIRAMKAGTAGTARGAGPAEQAAASEAATTLGAPRAAPPPPPRPSKPPISDRPPLYTGDVHAAKEAAKARDPKNLEAQLNWVTRTDELSQAVRQKVQKRWDTMSPEDRARVLDPNRKGWVWHGALPMHEGSHVAPKTGDLVNWEALLDLTGMKPKAAIQAGFVRELSADEAGTLLKEFTGNPNWLTPRRERDPARSGWYIIQRLPDHATEWWRQRQLRQNPAGPGVTPTPGQ